MEPRGYSLFSKKGMGGVIGDRGYTFQDAFIISKLPQWIGCEQFISIMKEGFEDVDVKFYVDGVEIVHFYQIKDHDVGLTDFRDIIENFYEKKSTLPNNSRFILISTGLADTCESIKTRIESYRESLKMYEEVSLHTTRKDFESLVEKNKIDVPLDFLLDQVFFETNLGQLTNCTRLCDGFVGAMLRINEYRGFPVLVLHSIYNNLFTLFSSDTRKVISKDNIIDRINETASILPQVYNEKGITVRLFHWEVEAFDLSKTWDILLDWSEYFDRQTRTIPESNIWNTKFVSDLLEAERNIRLSTESKKIVFYPSACLSAGFLLGSTFKQVKGYSIDIHQNNQIWSSNNTISKNQLGISTEILNPESNNLCVECNVSANVESYVDQYCEEHSIDFSDRVSLFPDIGIGNYITNEIASAYSLDFKNKLREVRRKNTDVIHLFYAGPLGLSVLMGWRFNAMEAKIQCYEARKGSYIPTCLINAN